MLTINFSKKATILCNILYTWFMHAVECLCSFLHTLVPFPSAYRESGCFALNLSRGGHILRLLVGISLPLVYSVGQPKMIRVCGLMHCLFSCSYCPRTQKRLKVCLPRSSIPIHVCPLPFVFHHRYFLNTCRWPCLPCWSLALWYWVASTCPP